MGNPIKSKEMFFGREEDFKHIQNWIVNDGPHVILLIGGRRSGKTSILWQIWGGRLHQAGEAVLCDFHKIVPRMKQDEDFPFEVGKAILENQTFKQFEPEFLEDDNSSWTVRLQKLVQNCLALIEPRKLIVLCDEFEAIEELFKSEVLSANALLWVKQVFDLPVHFVITGSHEFKESTVSSVFSPVAQMHSIYELSMPDALALIQKPIGDHLIYNDEVLEIIHRLSGGHPFYTQYICHTLVNNVNAEIKRNYVVAKDLDGVVDFIVRSPTGHIQETWKSLSNPNYAPKYGRETLAALANTIKQSKEYVSTSKIFKTVRKKRFEVVDKQALYKTLAWFVQDTRLLERNSENYRFRTDVIRHWIAYEFQTGEDIEPLKGDLSGTDFIKRLTSYKFQTGKDVEPRIGGSVMPTPTQPKKEEAGQLGYSSSATENNWTQKYQKSCILLKSQYPNGVPKKELKNLHDTYISKNRISEAQAKEIDVYYQIVSPKKYRWAAAIGIVIFIGVVLFLLIGDKVKPLGQISDIDPNYREGDEIVYSIEGSDNEALNSVTFTVEDSPVKQTWEVNSQEIQKTSTFSTKGWQLKRYNYLLTVVDKAGNIFITKENSFLLEKAMSRLLLSTVPSDTTISFLDAKTLFQHEVSTSQEIELPANQYHIEISKPGYESVKKRITLEGGKPLQLKISLFPQIPEKLFGLVFVWIPNCEDNKNECTSGFWMSQTEISQKQWMDVMKSNNNPSRYKKGETYPVERISWLDAKAFAENVNKRLCSAQEWQKAFGYLKKDVVLNNAILGKKINAGPEPIDSLGDKSELGVLNLIGNVSEWVDDNGQAAYSGLHWAEIETVSNLKRANQITTVFSLFKSSRIGIRLCMTQ